MTQYLSDKLRVLSLISIIFVLYIHSGFHPNEIEGMVMNDRVQSFISGIMGQCAVPLFYIISGYLFFLKVPNGIQSVYSKIRKRVKTLLIPYIIGCLFCVGFGAFVALMPGTSRFMNSSVLPILQKPINELICVIFYDAGNGSPYAFQLWFLRDLIIIVATSPIWYLCLKHFKWLFVVIVFGLTYLHVPHIPFYALSWFTFGGQMVYAKSLSGGGKKTDDFYKCDILVLVCNPIIAVGCFRLETCKDSYNHSWTYQHLGSIRYRCRKGL